MTESAFLNSRDAVFAAVVSSIALFFDQDKYDPMVDEMVENSDYDLSEYYSDQEKAAAITFNEFMDNEKIPDDVIRAPSAKVPVQNILNMGETLSGVLAGRFDKEDVDPDQALESFTQQLSLFQHLKMPEDIKRDVESYMLVAVEFVADPDQMQGKTLNGVLTSREKQSQSEGRAI